MLGRNALFARNLGKSMVRYSSNHGGVPGGNLPFELGNIYKFTAMFAAYFGIGLGAPWLVVRHQFLKK